MRKFAAIFIILVIVSVSSISCQTTSVSQGIFRSALISDPPAIDPANAIEQTGQSITQLLFDGLVKYNPKTLEIEPAVAQTWEISKDAKTFTFKLRKDVKFQNGEEVNAQNFKDAADYIANPKNKAQASYYFEQIEGYGDLQDKKASKLTGVKVKDKYTLQITLSTPLVDFVRSLSATGFSPLPKNFKDKGFAKKPVGNGPYKIVSWKKNKEITIERFDGYYGNKAEIKKATFKIFSDPDAPLREFKAGNLDDAPISKNQVKITKEKGDLKLVTIPLLSTYSYGFNLKKKPWDDENLRLAIAHAINKKEIVEKILPSDTKTATSFTAAAVPGNNEPLSDVNFNLSKSKKMLKEAGYSNAKDIGTITISYDTAEASNSKVAQVIQSQLEKAGFEAKIQGLEHGTFIDKMLGGELEIFQVSWTGDANFDAFLDPIFSSDSIGMNNVTNYSNEEVDDLIVEAQSTKDDEKRTDLYKKAEKIILGEAPVIPLYYDSVTYAVGDNVKTYIRSAYEDLALDQMELK